MTFTDYLVRNFGLDLRQALQLMALALFLCGFGWMGLWLCLRRRISAARARDRRYNELAQLFEVRMHAKEYGLTALQLQKLLVERLAAQGHDMNGVDIREVLELALHERYRRGRGMADDAAPAWWLPLNGVLEKSSIVGIITAGCLLAVDYWRMLHYRDDMFDTGVMIGMAGMMFIAFSFISNGKWGGLLAMFFTLVIFHTTIGLVRPTVARMTEQFYRDYRESLLPPAVSADTGAVPRVPAR